MKLLNIGCGNHFHPAWINIDLVAQSPDVIESDLTRGLPLEDESMDAVYHSHVLEHLSPNDAEVFLRECQRVLKPGGVLRVVVPDLEDIARHYLSSLESASQNDDPIVQANHRWMMLELVDQMVRIRTGGEMGAVLQDQETENKAFVQSRVGMEWVLEDVPKSQPQSKRRRTLRMRLKKLFRKCQKAATRAAVFILSGRRGVAALDEGLFRQSGEVHRWMYDRVSLARLLESIGFDEPLCCSAIESRIQSFAEYQLDCVSTQVRKPDSLFVEALKPARAASASERRAA